MHFKYILTFVIIIYASLNVKSQVNENNVNSLESKNTIIFSALKFSERPGIGINTGNFSFGLGYDFHFLNLFNIRIFGSRKSGKFKLVGSCSDEMLGYNFKFGINKNIVELEKYNLIAGINFNHERTSVEIGSYLGDKSLTKRNGWEFYENFNSIELFLENEYNLFRSFFIYVNSSIKYGKIKILDNMNGDTQYNRFRIPLIENIGLRYKF